MADLSPAAQAVLDAFLKDAGEDATLRLFQGELAAALQAAVDQLKDPYPSDQLDTFEKIQSQLLAIAAELGSTPIDPLEEN